MSAVFNDSADLPAFQSAEPHPREDARLRALHELNVLDTAQSKRFDRITVLAADLFAVPTALISLVDANRQWFLSRCGLDASETSREVAFCAHALHEEALLVVEDASLDPRFAQNPLVVNPPHIRFYAGAVLRNQNGLPLGTLCLLGTEPRKFTEDEQRRLLQLAELVRGELVPNDESMLERARAQLNAQVDPLTKAWWQQGFAEVVDRYFEAAHEETRSVFASVALPNLQFLNDVFGRMVGDEILMETASRIVETCRGLGEVELGRLGGEHLTALIIECRERISVQDVEAALVGALSNPITTSTGAVSPDVRIGLTECTGHSHSYGEILERCRVAVASEGTRVGVVSAVFSEEKQQPFLRRLQVAADLRNAIDNNELHLVYQPKVRTADQTLGGFECLLRWNHEKIGHVSPLQIVDVARDINLTEALDHWVIEAALGQMAQWRQGGITYGSISVNVTGATILAPDFSNWLNDVLQRYDVPPKHLDLEVVESSIFDEFAAAIEAMQAVSALGVTFSLDDFGTGHSSLAYLKQLPVHTVKIDKAFVDRIFEDEADAALCAGIVSMTRELGLAAVAEGVETEQQYVMLRAYRCEYQQGYFFSKPLAVPDVSKLIQTGL